MAEVDDKNGSKQATRTVAAQSTVIPTRRFETAGDATDELFEGFNDWSASISSYGMQAAYSVIAANWAVYGSANAIITNYWARTSMALVITFIGVNLFLTWRMTVQYQRRLKYADDDKDRWHNEFNHGEDASSAWPYTSSIQSLGASMRLLKTWAPIGAGLIFVMGLIFG